MATDLTVGKKVTISYPNTLYARGVDLVGDVVADGYGVESFFYHNDGDNTNRLRLKLDRTNKSAPAHTEDKIGFTVHEKGMQIGNTDAVSAFVDLQDGNGASLGKMDGMTGELKFSKIIANEFNCPQKLKSEVSIQSSNITLDVNNWKNMILLDATSNTIDIKLPPLTPASIYSMASGGYVDFINGVASVTGMGTYFLTEFQYLLTSCDFTNSSTTVTGTSFISLDFYGDLVGKYIKKQSDDVSAFARIASVDSDTSMTLETSYAGSTSTEMAVTSNVSNASSIYLKKTSDDESLWCRVENVADDSNATLLSSYGGTTETIAYSDVVLSESNVHVSDTAKGRTVCLKRIDTGSNVITITADNTSDGASSQEKIEGNSSITIPVGQYKYVTLFGDTRWYIIGSN